MPFEFFLPLDEQIPSGQTRPQVPQPVQRSRSTSGQKVRQLPVLLLIVVPGLEEFISQISKSLSSLISLKSLESFWVAKAIGFIHGFNIFLRHFTFEFLLNSFFKGGGFDYFVDSSKSAK